MTTATVLTALVGAASVGWFLGCSTLARRHDVSARRSLYQSLPAFTGAATVGEHSFDLKSDGVGTVLTSQDGESTLFAPGKGPEDEQRWTCVTIKVSPGRGQAERVSLTEATFTCHER
jgi:hypothetical protein